MRVALVYDRVNKWGGAERVLLALHRIWPDAPLFTAVYDPRGARWADVFTVHPSFLQRIPFTRGAHESLLGLTPLAFESFTFDEYDVVISVTSAEAKNIITKPETLHVCYCLTPTRYLWSGFRQYQNQPGLGLLNVPAAWGLRVFGPLLRDWDVIAASRPDHYIAISNRVKTRIETYYRRNVTEVIYPPVDTKKFSGRGNVSRIHASDGQYFLTVSRLVSYKRLDILIRAFNALGLPLVIVGDGRQRRELMRMANANIRFVDHYLTDSDLVRYYEGCRAFVFAADEDFGLAAAEAHAAGKPVIAYRESGVAEIVRDGVTGILFDRQTEEGVIDAVRQFTAHRFSAAQCRRQVAHISESHFETRMRKVITDLYTQHTHL